MSTTTFTRLRTGWPDEIDAADALERLLQAHERAAWAAAEVDTSAGHLVTELADEARAVTVLLSGESDAVRPRSLPAAAPLVVRQRDLGIAPARLLSLHGRRGWTGTERAYVQESTGRVDLLADTMQRGRTAPDRANRPGDRRN